MTKHQALGMLVLILLAAFFLRTYRLLDFPLFGDEVDEGDIAVDILHGHWAFYYPQNEGNEPLFQLTMAPFFAVLGDSVIANRFPSLAWSIVFCALMYAYGRVLFKSRRVGVLSAALAASLWWSTLFGRLGLREISQPTLMIPALISLILLLRDTNTTRTRLIALTGGLFAGLTSYTFPSGRGFPVLVIAFLLYAALAHRNQLRSRWCELSIYVMLMIAISIPLWAYLIQNPAEDYHVGDLMQRSWLAQGKFEQFFPNLRDTLGMFTFRGDMDWAHNIAGRPVFPGIEGWIFYLGVAMCLWRWRKTEYGLQLIVLAVMLAPNVLAENPPRWTRSVGILPGLISTTVVPVELVWERLAGFPHTRIAYGALVALLGLSIYSRTAFDIFDVWIDAPGVYGMTLAYYDSAGRYIHRSPDPTPVNYVMDVYTGWREHNVTRAAAPSKVEMRFSIHNALVFPDMGGRASLAGARIAFQNLAAPPTALLSPFIDLGHPIFTDPRVDSAGNHPLQIFLAPRARLEEHLALAKSNPVFLPGSNAQVDAFQVADFLEFNGYEIVNATARAGQTLNVLTYWRVLRIPPNLAIFLHLLDPNGKVIAQYDGFDVVTQDLKPDDLVVQLHALEQPANLPNATYHFEIGAYLRADDKRLPLISSEDHLWLRPWEIGK